MRSVIQRVEMAFVSVDHQIIGKIDRGLFVLLGVGAEDQESDARWTAEKLVELRAFEDAQGKMNLSVRESGGEILLVSQFTLFGDCRKGMRPSFSSAASLDKAKMLYELTAEMIREKGIPVATGKFQAKMKIQSVNDGPVTLLLDSKKIF